MIQSILQSSEGKRQLAKAKKVQITDEVRRAKAKSAAVLRAQFNLKVALDRIDFKHDVIEPTLNQVELDATKGELPEFTIETGI